jgi:hypothetical protein
MEMRHLYYKNSFVSFILMDDGMYVVTKLGGWVLVSIFNVWHNR